jgi:hypothetical protein
MNEANNKLAVLPRVRQKERPSIQPRQMRQSFAGETQKRISRCEKWLTAIPGFGYCSTRQTDTCLFRSTLKTKPKLKRKYIMGIRDKNRVEEVAEDVKAAVAGVIDQQPEVVIEEAVDSPVAVVNNSSNVPAVAEAAKGNVNVMADLAGSGFEGLEINFTSFETIVLEKSSFTCAQSERKIKEDFVVTIQSTRNKYLFSSTHEKADDREAVYSYNVNADTQDKEVMDKIAAWKEQDQVGYVKKTYIEAVAIVEDDKANGDLNGEMVILQIPPASIGKLSGFLAQQRLKGRGLPNAYSTVVGVGGKIGDGQTAFYPWIFSEFKG